MYLIQYKIQTKNCQWQKINIFQLKVWMFLYPNETEEQARSRSYHNIIFITLVF